MCFGSGSGEEQGACMTTWASKTSMQRDPPYMDAHILMQRISGEVENKDQNLNFVILELMGRTYTKFYVKSLVI